MTWKEVGSPKWSLYDIALRRMFFAESRFWKMVDEEVRIRSYWIKPLWPRFHLHKLIIINLNGTFQCKLCSHQKGPRKFDSSSIHLQKVMMFFPLTITILRKILTSSIVFWVYWQHGDGTQWHVHSPVKNGKFLTKSYRTPTIKCMTGFYGRIRQVINQMFIHSSD